MFDNIESMIFYDLICQINILMSNLIIDLAEVGGCEVEDSPQVGLAVARLHRLHLVSVILILSST